MAEFIINDQVNKSHVLIYRNILDNDQATKLFEYLVQNVPWEQNELTLYGRKVQENRLTALYGDVKTHTYSGKTRNCQPWLPILEQWKYYFNNAYNTKLNAVLLNYYRTGHDYISYHSDAEVTEPMNYVFALSLGASRRFLFRNIATQQITETSIHNGDLMVMYGDTQKHYQHSIPKHTGKVADSILPRISLTFRELRS